MVLGVLRCNVQYTVYRERYVETSSIIHLYRFMYAGAALYGVFILLCQPLRAEVVEQT